MGQLILQGAALAMMLCPAGVGFQAAAVPDATKAGPRADVAPQGVPRFQERNPRYQIRPADIIDLVFFPAAEFNQTVTVQPDGYISLREAGDVYVQGKTLPEMVALATSLYGKILNDPVITVTLKEFEKPHFTVGGQVGRPGKYELRADTTVSEAVAIAGGITEKAKHSAVLLFRRVSDDWAEAKLVDLKAIQKGRLEEDIHLHPGDMLFVPQNAISKIKPFIPVWSLGTYLGGGRL